MIVVFFALLFGSLRPHADFWLASKRYVRERAEADKAAAELAEAVSASIARIQVSNEALEGLYKACPETLGYPPAVASLSASGQAIALEQEMEKSVITARAAEKSLEGSVKWSPVTRLPVRECEIPDLLRLSTTREAFAFENDIAGVEIDVENEFSAPEWKFVNANVDKLD